MNKEQPVFISDPEIERTFRKRSKTFQRRRQLYREKKMENQANNANQPLRANNGANDRREEAVNHALAQA